MSTAFNPAGGLVIFRATLHGPNGSGTARFGLDTGATVTAISPRALRAVGIDPMRDNVGTVPVITANGVISVPLVTLDKMDALGQTQTGVTVQAHTLPPGLPIDGLLGLDFLRVYRLVVDFRTGQITLT